MATTVATGDAASRVTGPQHFRVALDTRARFVSAYHGMSDAPDTAP
jgi:hypothetical protein